MGHNAGGILLFGVSGAAFIVYAAYQYISFMMNRGLIDYTTAVIIDTVTALPETMQKNNSRWATVRFKVDEKFYVSSNRIQVPLYALEGDEIKIAYYKENPSELFTVSLKNVGVFFIIGAFCMAIMLYLMSNN